MAPEILRIVGIDRRRGCFRDAFHYSRKVVYRSLGNRVFDRTVRLSLRSEHRRVFLDRQRRRSFGLAVETCRPCQRDLFRYPALDHGRSARKRRRCVLRKQHRVDFDELSRHSSLRHGRIGPVTGFLDEFYRAAAFEHSPIRSLHELLGRCLASELSRLPSVRALERENYAVGYRLGNSGIDNCGRRFDDTAEALVGRQHSVDIIDGIGRDVYPFAIEISIAFLREDLPGRTSGRNSDAVTADTGADSYAYMNVSTRHAISVLRLDRSPFRQYPSTLLSIGRSPALIPRATAVRLRRGRR